MSEEVKQQKLKLAPKKELTPEEVAKAQADHATHKWYDKFDCQPIKRSVINPYTDKIAVIIRGFQLGKKHHPIFTQERQIKGNNTLQGLNTFVVGWDGGSGGSLPHIYLEKGKYQNGDFIPYRDFAELMGFDLKKDKNLLFAEFDDAPAA